jgi:ribosome-binding protein aMBF1 (putative translation factor)
MRINSKNSLLREICTLYYTGEQNEERRAAMAELPSFADRLHMARRRAGLDQEALGKRVGLAGYTIGRLERGETQQISIKALRLLPQALGVELDWLLAMDVPNDPEDETARAAPHMRTGCNAAHVRGRPFSQTGILVP